MNPKVRVLDRRSFLAYAVCSLMAVFYLPYLAPLQPTASVSYLFGYNNRAGVVLLVLLVTVGTLWSRGLDLQFLMQGDSPPVSRKTLALSLLAVLLGCLAMYALAGRFGGFEESGYEIRRLWLASQGKIPYVDFEWAYGVSFLYGPLLLQRLLSLTLLQAYHLFWTLNCLLGTFILYWVVNLIDYPTQYKRSIFLLFYCAGYFSSVISMGAHCTYLRFISPLLFILAVQKLLKRGGARWQLSAAALAVAFTVVLLVISPEIALAFAFACALVFLFSSPGLGRGSLAIFACLAIALAGVFGVALKLHVLDTLKAFGGGSENFPIFFAPHIVLYFAAIFVCACYLFRRFRQGLPNDNTIGLIAFSVPMIAGALGRCDAFHVVLDGAGIFLASLFYISDYKNLWKWYRLAFVLILIVLPALSGGWLYLPEMAKVGLNTLSEGSDRSLLGKGLLYAGKKYVALYGSPAKRAKWEAHLANAQRYAVPEKIDFATIYPSWRGTFLAPFGYTPNGLGTYLSDQIDDGRYQGIDNADTLVAKDEKLAELARHPGEALLLPDRFENLCRVDASADRKMISMLFAFPYLGRAVHQESIRQPLCDTILAHYRMVQAPDLEDFSYGLWMAKAEVSPR